MPKSSRRKHETRRANRDRRQRLEELRKQQRAAERRKNLIFAGSGIVVAIGLIAAAVIPAYLHDLHKRDAAKKQFKVLQLKPTAAETAAGCDGVHQDPVSESPTNSHETTAIDYSKEKYGDTEGGTPPIPPTGGHHNPISLGDKVRFYPLAQQPRPERAVHNLEHGYVVVWYDSKLPQSDVAKLEADATNGSLSRLLVVGWWQSELPANKHVVLTSWGRTERCSTVSDTVIRNFYQDHLNAPIAPEAGLGAIANSENIPASQLPGAQASSTPTAPASSPTAPGTPPSTTPSPSSSGKYHKKK